MPTIRGPIREQARAKINLDLHVLARRADGYHAIDSLIVFAAFGDTVRLAPAAGLSLTLEGPFAAGLPADDGNLALRAARALQALTGQGAGAAIAVTKAIPVAAGLGGGSADAAAVLRGLVRLWGVVPAPADLAALAATVGADVPACLASRPLRATGVGDRLEPLDLPAGLGIVLANPGITLATAAVFGGLRPPFGPPPPDLPARLDAAGLVAALAARRNDLEAPAIAACPPIAGLLAALAVLPGARLARMSGSGASGFALFDNAAAADAAARLLAAAHPAWWVQSSVFHSARADG